AREAGQAVGIGGEPLGQDLDRDVAAELGIGGAPDRPHSALAELGGDAIVCDRILRAHSSRQRDCRVYQNEQGHARLAAQACTVLGAATCRCYFSPVASMVSKYCGSLSR